MKFSSSRTTLSSSPRAGRVPSVDAGGLPVGPVTGESVGGGPVGGDPVGPVPTKNAYAIIFLFLGGAKRSNRVNEISLH